MALRLLTPMKPLCPAREIPIMEVHEDYVVVGTHDFNFPITGNVAERFKAWQKGERTQVVFPELTTDQREWLMTGLSPAAWDKLMGEEDWDLNAVPDDVEDEDELD